MNDLGIRNKRIIIFGFIFISILLLIVAFAAFNLKKENNNKIASSKVSLNKAQIPYKILFVNSEEAQIYNIATQKIKKIADTNPDGWTYKEPYLYVSDDKSITRIDLNNNERIVTSLEDYVEYINNTSTTKEVPYFPQFNIIPDKTGDRIAVIANQTCCHPGNSNSWNFENSLLLINFSSNEDKIITNDVKSAGWDFSGDLAYSKDRIYIVDKDSGNQIFQSKEIVDKPIYPFGNEDKIFWVGDDKHYPELINSETAKKLPDLNTISVNKYLGKYDQFHSENIPFTKFPTIARDFDGISKVMPTNKSFILQIDSVLDPSNVLTVSDIFLTDARATFKKLNPTNKYSYSLIDINEDKGKVLAHKAYYEEGKSPDESTVLLNMGNYAETIAGIWRANYKEREVSGKGKGISISPDGNYVLFSNTNNNNTKFSIVSVNNAEILDIQEYLGDKQYWIEAK